MVEGQGAYAVGIPTIDALHVELEERLAALNDAVTTRRRHWLHCRITCSATSATKRR